METLAQVKFIVDEAEKEIDDDEDEEDDNEVKFDEHEDDLVGRAVVDKWNGGIGRVNDGYNSDNDEKSNVECLNGDADVCMISFFVCWVFFSSQ